MTNTTDDDRAIRQLIARCEAAWNAGDSVGFANCMAEDVDSVGILGERYSGREILERGHRHIFDTIYKDSRVRYTVERVRFLKLDVAIATVHQAVKSHLPQSAVASTARQREMTEALHDTESRATYTAVKTSGQWLVVAMHNTLVASVVTGHTQGKK